MALIDCVGEEPTRIKDTTYDPAKEIEALLRIMRVANKLCRVKGRTVYDALSLPQATCGQSRCGRYSLGYVEDQWARCCGGVGRIYG